MVGRRVADHPVLLMKRERGPVMTGPCAPQTCAMSVCACVFLSFGCVISCLFFFSRHSG